MNSRINFFNENTSYIIKKKGELRKWIMKTIEGEGRDTGDLNFVLCDDEYLLALNRNYLQHDTFTDILTFPMSEENGKISGDIFISYPRIKENALSYNQKLEDELHRVMIHGVLHLLGYEDSSESERMEMREKESYNLDIFRSTSLSHQ
jgi:rRNA maturation RNase YbeY